MVKAPYNVDRLACAAAVAAIEDRDYHDRLVAFVREEREWLTERLLDAGLQVAPSEANFLFVWASSEDGAKAVAAALRDRQILVRHYDRDPVAGWLRITIGTRKQHERLLQVMTAGSVLLRGPRAMPP